MYICIYIRFPYIFFSCINLNYDNDVHLSTHEVVKIIDLNFENLEYFVIFNYLVK
jgi:hypothetical protein